MNEQEINVVLQGLLATIKTAERKAIDSGNFCNVRDIFIIHMAVVEATFDIDSALNALAKVFEKRVDTE
jgi:hypothetical protein